MGTKATSTRRTQAASAISGQTTTVYSASGIAVTGAKVTPTTTLIVGVVTPGKTSASSAVAASGSVVSAKNVGYNLVFGDYT